MNTSIEPRVPDLERQLLNQIALVHETSLNGFITHVNANMCAKTGYTKEELIGFNHRIVSPDLPAGASWLDLHKPDPTSTFLTGETLNRTKGGSDLWLSTTVAPIRDRTGTVTGHYFVSLDITEQKKLHQEFQRSGKLMQLGQLTAMVAHEIRNPLGAIRTANYVLERKLNGQIAGVEPQLERINVSIRRCDKIITELLDFSRKKTAKMSTLPVDAWLAETVQDIGKSLPSAPLIVTDLGLGASVAAFDPEQMRQVIINLLSNAAEAMAEKTKGGTAEPGYRPVITVATRRDGTEIQIIVSDNGPGIEPKNLKRVREPLFTTKSFGVGLGISAIEKVLNDHRGSLGIESKPGQGATMTASFQSTGADLAAF